MKSQTPSATSIRRLLAGYGVICAVILTPLIGIAETDTAALIKTIEAKIQELQKQLAILQAQVPASSGASAATFSKNLSRGSRDTEVKRLQEFLATVPEFYPEGLVTGYFGRLTEEAVKRLQKTYGISALGVVGPKTRAKLNELSALKVPLPQIEPVSPTPSATTTTSITPAPEPIPAPVPAPIVEEATSTPPIIATSTPAAITAPATTPVVLPTPFQLGLPIISFFGWDKNRLKVQFTHEPTSFTRSYAVYLRAPNQTASTKSGPYALLDLGSSSTSTDGATFKRAGPTGWEWTKTLDFNAEADGTYQIFITAVGDGNVESTPSPIRIATLYPKAMFDELLEGAPVQAVQNLAVTRFPLTVRIANFNRDLYYRYEIYDGGTRVWDSAYVNSASNPKIEVSFQNTNGYPFTAGRTYRLIVSSFDNNNGLDSTIKQKTNELIFTYAP